MCRDLWNWQTKNPQGYDVTQQPSPTINVPNGANEEPIVNINGLKIQEVKADQADRKESQPLPGALLVAAPTIPSDQEMFDPSTPAHISPAVSDDERSGGDSILKKFGIKALSGLHPQKA